MEMVKMEYKCKTPIVFIFFNRVEPMTKVLERIREVKPSKMYFISDGPRNEAEREKVDNCRKTAESIIDWDCEIIKNYSDTNMGCKYRPYTGISYALEREDKVIILEDDILPSISFFRFMDEMLEKYSEYKDIMMVSGNNVISDIYTTDGNVSYLFSAYPSIWGWGTWKRAWKKMDINMSDWKETRKNFNIKPWTLKYVLKRQYDKVYFKESNIWDFQWQYARYKNNGIGVVPLQNLITNIGFGKDATHTTKKGKMADVQSSEIEFPLTHPSEVVVNTEYDNVFVYNIYSKGIFKRLIKDFVKKIIKYNK
jgi:hypothetical protein